MLNLILGILLFGSALEVKALGPETVEVIYVKDVTLWMCPSSAVNSGGMMKYNLEQTKSVPGCHPVVRSKVIFKRLDGTSGEIITAGRPNAKRMVVNFCRMNQGEPEKPCTTQGL